MRGSWACGGPAKLRAGRPPAGQGREKMLYGRQQFYSGRPPADKGREKMRTREALESTPKVSAGRRLTRAVKRCGREKHSRTEAQGFGRPPADKGRVPRGAESRGKSRKEATIRNGVISRLNMGAGGETMRLIVLNYLQKGR